MPTFSRYDRTIAQAPGYFLIRRRALVAASPSEEWLRAAAKAGGFDPNNIKTVRMWGQCREWMQLDIASRVEGKTRRDSFHFPIQSIYNGLPKEMWHKSKSNGVVVETRLTLKPQPHFSGLGITLGQPFADEPAVTRQRSDGQSAPVIEPVRQITTNFEVMREWALRVAKRVKPDLRG